MASLLTPNPPKSDDAKDSAADKKRAAINEAARRLPKAPAKKTETKEPEKAKEPEAKAKEDKPGMLDAKLLAVARQKFLDRDKKKSKGS